MQQRNSVFSFFYGTFLQRICCPKPSKAVCQGNNLLKYPFRSLKHLFRSLSGDNILTRRTFTLSKQQIRVTRQQITVPKQQIIITYLELNKRSVFPQFIIAYKLKTNNVLNELKVMMNDER